VTELVVPLVLRRSAQSPSTSPKRERPQASGVAENERLRPPGSEWIFAKLYGPRAFQDDLLTGPVARLCGQVTASGAADSWFFIRYADPEPHLRLRFRGEPKRLLKEVVPAVCDWTNGLMQDELITRLSFDTYEREVERFGGSKGLAAAEMIFHGDSDATIEMLRLHSSGLLNLDMTTLAMLSIDDLLASIGLAESERVSWYRERAPSRTLGKEEYRRRKNELRALFADPEQLRTRPGGDALAQVFGVRRRALAEVGPRLDALAQTGELSQSRSSLLRSYVHLHCNRLLTGGQADEETTLALLARVRSALSHAPILAADAGD
jgi:thiopeptide-type bacteriocin biosynthesis protein